MENNQDKYNNYTYNGENGSSSTVNLDKNGYYVQEEQNNAYNYSNGYNNPYSSPNGPGNANAMNNNQYGSQQMPADNAVGTSVVSMVFGIIGLLSSGIFGTGIIFVIVSLILRADYRKRNNKKDNGYSKAGLVTSIIGIIFGIISFIVFVVLPILASLLPFVFLAPKMGDLAPMMGE